MRESRPQFIDSRPIKVERSSVVERDVDKSRTR